jgi:class 3 adenylate cyclase/tetratricopeptide (TPR) repeat protein
MRCQVCQSENRADVKFCEHCGNRLELVCPGCGARLPGASKFCGECGHPLAAGVETAKTKLRTESQRKRVTVLFSDMSGYTTLSERLDPEEIRDIMNRIFDEIAKVVVNYEGFVEKFIGDAVMAIFGVPKSHEDDAIRAVRVAREIHIVVETMSAELKTVTGQSLSMHSGVSTGVVVTGDLDLDTGSHGVLGATVNLASRLSSLARPSEILVSPETHRLIAPYFNMEALPETDFKGIAQPIVPYRVLEESNVQSRFEASQKKGFTEFAGRQDELAALYACLDKAAAGSGQFVTVVGEAGLGKSRLLYEFRHSINRSQITILQGRCQSYGSKTPYLPFINALRRGLQLRQEDSPLRLQQKAVANVLQIDPALALYLPMYLHLLSIPSEKYRLPEDLLGPKLESALQNALAAIFTLSSRRRPMVLVMEDWHWVDEASNKAMHKLIGMTAAYPLMLVVLYRPGNPGSWPAIGHHTPIVLKSLETVLTVTLIKSILGAREVAPELADGIHERTGGNPFFVEELCEALKAVGLISVLQGKASLNQDLDHLVLPDSIEAVIRTRIDLLEADAREALKMASVIGREFQQRILEHMPGVSSELSQTLLDLTTKDLIMQTMTLPEAEYMFKHVLTQVAVYEGLLLKQRKNLHGIVGRVIEKLYAERLEEHYEKLAYHFSHSNNADKAIEYLQLAGDKSTRYHSLVEARGHYREALALFTSDEIISGQRQTYIDLSLKWAEVSQYSPSNSVWKALKRSLDHARKLGDEQRLAEVSYWVGRFAYMQGDFTAALPEIDQCIERARSLSNQKLLALSYNLRGRSCLYTSEYDRGLKFLDQGLEWIRPFGKWDDVVYSGAIRGLLLGLTGNFSRSVTAIRDAIETAKKHDILTFEGMAFGYLGALHFWYGNWHEAVAGCTNCLDISRRIGNPLPMAWATAFKGAALFNSGKLLEGLGTMQEAIRILSTTDSVLAMRFLCGMQAEHLAISGDWEQAQIMEKKASDFSQLGQRWGEIMQHRARAFIAAAQSPPEWSEVDRHMMNSIQSAEANKNLPELVVSLKRYGELLERKGDHSGAHTYAAKARALGRQIGFRI